MHQLTSERPRTLIRAADPAAFRDTLVALALDGRPREISGRAIVVPTRAAAELLRRSIEARLTDWRPSALIPALLTRDEWVARLHESLPGGRRLLSRVEREILIERAARCTAARRRFGRAPFELRPGLIGALLDFYDELNRRQRRVRRFAEVLFDQLRVERGTDRGSESLVNQTAFMGLTFLAYERSVEALGALDEHALARALIAAQPPLGFDHLVIAVADHPSDPRGLWPADFDLIGRLRALSRVDVVVTDETHDAGFRERIERELPGIVERRVGRPRPAAAIVCPGPASADRQPLCFVSRDREEELRECARMIRRRATEGRLRESTAIVLHRPLPYVYLASRTLAAEGVSCEPFDALPLAAEPYAAMLDLVLAFARGGGTRDAAVALLRCGLLRFVTGGEPVRLEDVASLASALAGRGALGEAVTFSEEVAAWFGDRSTRDRATRRGADRAAAAASMAHAALGAFRAEASASSQVRALSSFIRAHEIHPPSEAAWRERHLRARAAVLGVLDALADAYARHDDGCRDGAALTAAIRHAIEAQTFAPRRGDGGVAVVDAAAARFGDFDHVHLAGLVESDWPERGRRSIFFTAGLLRSLGWPQEPDELRAQEAAFRDLLALAARTTTLHAFELEGDAFVAVSPRLPMVVATSRAPVIPAPADPSAAPHPGGQDSPPASPIAFAALRVSRPPLSDRRYSGRVAPRPPASHRVSAVDRYVDCPFRYFAESVLLLPEEREPTAGLTPLERGTLVHDLFERFYRAWEARGGGTITAASLPDALALFSAIAREALATLPEADRALEETRLLGSIVARGLAERVFELEADAGGRIVRRLLEVDLRGRFDFPREDGGQRGIAIRAKADRIDVFDDGALRVVDYKLGALPDLDASVQVAVYAHAARQRLEEREGQRFSIGEAMYLAFGDDRRLEGKLGGRDLPVDRAVAGRAAEFATHVGQIEAGEFPPRPRRPAECAWCAAAGVCRKEYVTEDDEPANRV